MGGVEEDGPGDRSDSSVLQLDRRDWLKLMGSVGAGTVATKYDDLPRNLRDHPGQHTVCNSMTASGPDRDTAADPWTIAVLPDTQHYAQSDDAAQYMAAQTAWIADSAASENIVFATHEGDIVHDGSDDAQWDRITAAMEPLDGALPYSVIPGNHDWERTGDKTSALAGYTDRFGADRFDDRDWYGGAGPAEASHYQTFAAGDYEFLHIGLEWRPRDETVDWAQDVIDDHAGMPTILTTHAYLEDDTFSPGRIDTAEDQDGGITGHDGEYVFDNLIRPNEQIFTVCCGHVFRNWFLHDQGEYHQVSENDAGEPVYELLANYQGRDNGGNGWMRTVTFTPGGGSCSAAPDSIDVATYSPAADSYQRGHASDFRFELDFSERFNTQSDGYSDMF